MKNELRQLIIMNKNSIKLVVVIIFLILGLKLISNKVTETEQNKIQKVPETPTVLVKSKVHYENLEYGFALNLPDSWAGFSAVENKWNGDRINKEGEVILGIVSGPKILIRHPKWTEAVSRQDIPIMIFTLAQWSEMQNDEFHIGAAPINPSELGRNSKYVFALPARYNFSYLEGFEEVEKIISEKSLVTF